MSTPLSPRLTDALEALRRGEERAEAALLDLAYAELRRIAGRQMRGQPAGHTLQPTALVHEAYLRLLGGRPGAFRDRRHFFAAAARAMRSVLVDMARHRARLKRGGGRLRVTLEAHDGAAPGLDAEILAVHEALTRLEALDARLARTVELRFFGGLDMDETAWALGVSRRQAFYLWEHARSWLFRELHP
jgi:RNA polymerase sigma factor (TIGR02999 family)